MAERVCEIVAFSEILILGGIVKGGSPPLCLYPPLTRQNMAKKEKQLYRCSFVLDGQPYPYCDFYNVYAYSPCHAWQIVCKHLVEYCGIPMDSINQDTIKVNFKYPNFLK